MVLFSLSPSPTKTIQIYTSTGRKTDAARMSQTKYTPFWKQVRLSLLSSSDRGPDRSRELSLLAATEEDEDFPLADGGSTTPSLTEAESSTASSTPPRRPSRTTSSRSSAMESIRGCGLAGLRMDKQDLRRRVGIPNRLVAAMVEAIRSRDLVAALVVAEEGEGERWAEDAPESPLVVFVNSRSGGRHGPVLKGRLQDLIGRDQVFDLSVVKPSDFVQYGLACLERLADLGDYCAKTIRENLRIMVAGGDGTVGWVLGSLGELYVQNREPVPPVGIIPLGTGNDLSRSFGWGGSFPFSWRSAVKRSLYKAIAGPICRLDSWHIIVSVPEEEMVELPHSLRHLGESTLTLDGDIEGELPENVSSFDGVFYNYFSIGMDAQVAYSFHHLRDEKPYLAQGPITNKLIYTGYSCKQGWFFTPCMSDPGLRFAVCPVTSNSDASLVNNCFHQKIWGLKNILRLSIKKVNSSEWEQILVPSSVRAIVALNLHNYGSGRNPWGNMKPDYLEKRGFVEAHMDDGLLEIFGLKQGWHASLVMVELISAKHIAQASAIRLEIRGGEWRDAYMQMDGEPWKQPMSNDYSSLVEIKRVPYQSPVISGECSF